MPKASRFSTIADGLPGATAIPLQWELDAFVFGGLRGIPIPWRLIDCSFGVFGFIPLWFCQRSATELAEQSMEIRRQPTAKAGGLR